MIQVSKGPIGFNLDDPAVKKHIFVSFALAEKLRKLAETKDDSEAEWIDHHCGLQIANTGMGFFLVDIGSSKEVYVDHEVIKKLV